MKKFRFYMMLFLGGYVVLVLGITGFLAVWYKGLFADLFVPVVIYLFLSILFALPSFGLWMFKDDEDKEK